MTHRNADNRLAVDVLTFDAASHRDILQRPIVAGLGPEFQEQEPGDDLSVLREPRRWPGREVETARLNLFEICSPYLRAAAASRPTNFQLRRIAISLDRDLR